jgi:pyrroloquinoline quinone biosynthesis protein B
VAACDASPRARRRATRLHACLAVSARGERWYVINATPDIRAQIEATPELHPKPGRRGSRITAILLADAELDHTLGLLELREGSPFTVYATDVVLAALTDGLPVRRVLEPYTAADWRAVEPAVAFKLDERLIVEALAVDGTPPRYAASRRDERRVVAYRVTDVATGSAIVYAPAVERFSDALAEFAGAASWVFFDGTFWAEDDVASTAGRSLAASVAGHLPISGPLGSARRLAALRAERKVYVHINNTNPILDVRSPERLELAAAGLEGEDGLEVQIR